MELLVILDPDLEVVDDLIGGADAGARAEADAGVAVSWIRDVGTLYCASVDSAFEVAVLKSEFNRMPDVVVDLVEGTVDQSRIAYAVVDNRDVVLAERVAVGEH